MEGLWIGSQLLLKPASFVVVVQLQLGVGGCSSHSLLPLVFPGHSMLYEKEDKKLTPVGLQYSLAWASTLVLPGDLFSQHPAWQGAGNRGSEETAVCLVPSGEDVVGPGLCFQGWPGW